MTSMFSHIHDIVYTTRTLMLGIPRHWWCQARSSACDRDGGTGIQAAVCMPRNGVIAFMVATRTREIGVRVALGDALKLVAGICVGLVLAVLWRTAFKD